MDYQRVHSELVIQEHSRDNEENAGAFKEGIYCAEFVIMLGER
jgi:hypothetical protein